jgi:general secretion pathway protein F
MPKNFARGSKVCGLTVRRTHPTLVGINAIFVCSLKLIIEYTSMKKTSRKSLSFQDLAILYLQLSRLEKSGIPTERAMILLIDEGDEGSEISKRARMALNYLKRGKPLSEAGKRAGLFIGLDAALIEVAEESGTYGKVFQQLAQYYEDKARQKRQIKSRLFLPLIIFVLALFIQPVPALISGKITFISYLSATLGIFLQLALFVFILLHLSSWFRYGFLRSFRHLWDKIEINAPYFGYWFMRQNLRNFMQSLGLMLEAGLPILEALPKALQVVENTQLRQRLQTISTRLHKGDTFAEALSQVAGVGSVARQLISTGEQTGSLANILFHYVKLESEAIALHDDMLAAWFPRIIYGGVVAMIAYGILSTGSLMSPIPEDF